MGLRDIESTLPPGFRFHPSDEELVCHYLYKKVTNKGLSEGTMVEVDLHTREPWELPDEAKLSTNEWYFFSFRDRKYATGSRTNRATKSGYWKATGKDRTVYYPKTHAVVGMRKTLVFYRGRAPNGIKSGWVMHEFRMENPHTPPKEDWVLCRVFHKRKVNTENNSNAMEKERENTVECSSSPLQMESSPPPLVDDITLEGCLDLVSSSFAGLEHQDDMISSNPFLNLALVHYNLVDFGNPQDVDGSQMMMMGSSSGDGCGFLFDDDDEDAGAEQDDDNGGGTSGRDKLFF